LSDDNLFHTTTSDLLYILRMLTPRLPLLLFASAWSIYNLKVLYHTHIEAYQRRKPVNSLRGVLYSSRIRQQSFAVDDRLVS